AAGTDSVFPFDPLRSVWCLVTRGTRDAGILGACEAIDAPSAIRLYTSGGAALVGDGDVRGRILPGHHADLVACRVDPLTADVDTLPGTAPAFTLVGGHPAYDPDGRFRSAPG
ncbi:MAG TPA: amidohydrolase family protein, partial [Candidatus Limnocylindrales bacterium]